MTVEERFERIEHVTAGLAEERRNDREENRQLWRNTQLQIDQLSVRMNELTLKIADTNDAIVRLGEETREQIKHFAEESRAADERLGQRIESLVSAIGKMLAAKPGQ